jgi:hypothetical protein
MSISKDLCSTEIQMYNFLIREETLNSYISATFAKYYNYISKIDKLVMISESLRIDSWLRLSTILKPFLSKSKNSISKKY